ncbi:PaaI family thioesterase [Natronomonas sp. LN261]|uniref:PaaI family thioesterase n=1 Tax=Natronomonas sp. LN261 TaxID=2750669 RepID=UPI0015EF987B|nr:PaaI family thioesterase [Natronomonas sp. LN261]
MDTETDVEELFGRMPFNDHLGVEMLEIDDGHAVGELGLSEKHSSSPDRMIVHGGVTYALADTVGGAAVISANEAVTPTIDMRIDYLAPATGGTLRAEATVVRNGNNVATVEVEIDDDGGREIAVARGTYKSGGGEGTTAWREAKRE